VTAAEMVRHHASEKLGDMPFYVELISRRAVSSLLSKAQTAHQKEITMYAYLELWRALKTDRRAVTALEYGLIAAHIAGVIITAASSLGTNIAGTFNKMATTMSSATGGVQTP
jgi:pilus assembly protein Flp/PilA